MFYEWNEEKYFYSFFFSSSEREKESQRSPEFLGRNYSHCESTKTQSGATNDILGKKFSVQLSRENSQRHYSDSKTMTSHKGGQAARPQTSGIPATKQISKWLPIYCCDEKNRKQHPEGKGQFTHNNNILGREEAFTSFDSKTKGNMEQGI